MVMAMNDEKQTDLARVLAPEDIQRGMYVSTMHEVYEHVSCFFQPEPWSSGRPAWSLILPEYGSEPLKVIEICLPFILVEDSDGGYETVDVNSKRLAELSDRYGDALFMRAKAKRKAKHRRRRRRDKKRSAD